MRAFCLLGTTLALLGCGGTDPGKGQNAKLQIKGNQVQFVAGAFDMADRDVSPEVHSVATLNNQLYPGVANKNLSGTLGPESGSVLVGLKEDTGYWIVPVQDIDQNRTGDFTFSCLMSFAMDIEPGPLSLVFRSVAKDGRIGPVLIQPVIMEAKRPTGKLVVSLEWDTQADLDLHLSIPGADGGVEEIWSRKPSGVSKGSGATVAEGLASGYLDYDSNAQCVLDGRQQENIVFPESAPLGNYIARVDTYSLCGEAKASWRLRIFVDGVELPSQTYGQSTEADTRLPHGQGAGVQAIVFNN